MTLLLLVIATVINLFTIQWKLSRGRYKDVIIEVAIIVVLSSLFGGTLTGMAIATSVSAAWSAYTIIFNPYSKRTSWDW